VQVLGAAPTAVVAVAAVEHEAVPVICAVAASSPARNPVSVPVNTGFASPYTRDALDAVTVSGAFVIDALVVAVVVAREYCDALGPPSVMPVTVTGLLLPAFLSINVPVPLHVTPAGLPTSVHAVVGPALAVPSYTLSATDTDETVTGVWATTVSAPLLLGTIAIYGLKQSSSA
jgi:hypothetical protein